MTQSFANVWLHTVFSTIDRRRAFILGHMRYKTFAYMTGVFENLKCPVARIGMATDHVHILHRLSRTQTIADLVGTVKRQTTTWLVEQEWTHGKIDFHQFHWQQGYGTFSVSESTVSRVKQYIDEQMEHHRRISFQDEYRAFLKKYNVAYDERYVWD